MIIFSPFFIHNFNANCFYFLCVFAANQASASDVVVLDNQQEITPKEYILASDSYDSSQSSFAPEDESSSEISSPDESPKKKKKSKSKKMKKIKKKSKSASKKQGKGLRHVRRGNYSLCIDC